MKKASKTKRFIPIFLGIFMVVMVLAMLFGIWACFSINYGVDDAYALWGATDMVINYMNAHDGKWPRSWADLQPQFDESNGRVGGWSYQDFQDRITIDFNADPDQLRKQSLASPKATFRVIWPKHDWGVRMGDGPNQSLCDYFRGTPAKYDEHMPVVIPK